MIHLSNNKQTSLCKSASFVEGFYQRAVLYGTIHTSQQSAVEKYI